MQVNDVTYSGYLGQDARVFEASEGRKIVSLSIAHSYKYKKSSGEEVSVTTWATAKVFYPWSEQAANFKKGDNVVVKGSLSENKWSDKETGKERSTIEIRATSIGKILRDENKERKPAKKASIETQEINEIPF